LEHSPEEKKALLTTATELEESLKKISDEMESENPSNSPESRALVSVMRVGAYARGNILQIFYFFYDFYF